MKADGGRERDPAWSEPLELLRRVWCLNHALERMSSRMQRELGITAQQRLVLRCVGKYPGLTPGRLADMLHLDPGTVSATLRRLERNGLVARRRDARDKRRIALGLTPRGRTFDAPTSHTVERVVELLLASVSQRDIDATKRVVDALTALLDAHAREAALHERAPSRVAASPKHGAARGAKARAAKAQAGPSGKPRLIHSAKKIDHTTRNTSE